MSASLTTRSLPAFGGESRCAGVHGSEEAPVLWILRRNCSASPRQVMYGFVALAVVSAAISTFFWFQGALLVAPFAGLELVAVGAAWLVHARHATDQERIHLQPGRLTVERFESTRIERMEFEPLGVRVTAGAEGRALIELSASGRRVAVGRHVPPARRRRVADELGRALRHLSLSRTTGLAPVPHHPDV